MSRDIWLIDNMYVTSPTQIKVMSRCGESLLNQRLFIYRRSRRDKKIKIKTDSPLLLSTLRPRCALLSMYVSACACVRAKPRGAG